MKPYRVLLFYKYITVENPGHFVKEHIAFCIQNEIKGRVFIAKEGINGTVSGLKDNIELYKNHLTGYPFFNDLIFKEDEADEHAFKKMHVRLKEELVNTGRLNVNLENGGIRLKPKELKAMYDNNEDFIIIDARNDYESKIGKFHNAVTQPLKTFRDWTAAVEKLKKQKEKKIVTYCTGGIRCEKASAYMREQGFKNVFQLDGGIVSYTKLFPDTYWEGGIFVFDERRVVEPNSKDELKNIGECYHCGNKTSYYINCHNQDCDKLFVCCHECKIKTEYSCSEECRNAPNRRKIYHG